MTDEQMRRYARHILLPDVGGIGQHALLAHRAAIDPRASDAAAIASEFLQASGVTVTVSDGIAVPVPPPPPWWPGSHRAPLAWWRGSIAALAWMSDVIASAR